MSFFRTSDGKSMTEMWTYYPDVPYAAVNDLTPLSPQLSSHGRVYLSRYLGIFTHGLSFSSELKQRR